MQYKMKLKKFFNNGFTVTETLIVIAIMIVLITVTLAVFSSFKNYEALNKDAQMVIETIRQAKNLTLNSKNSSQYGVHFESGSLTLFVGSTYTAGTTTNQVYSFNPSVTATTSLSGGVNIVFKRLTGETDNNGTITLSSAFSTTTKTITVYKTGLAE
jgi:type II secretory pathway pseudopilin PulG